MSMSRDPAACATSIRPSVFWASKMLIVMPRFSPGRSARATVVGEGISSEEGDGGDERYDGEGDPGRRVLLGHAGPHPEAARRHLDARRLHGRRRPERDL